MNYGQIWIAITVEIASGNSLRPAWNRELKGNAEVTLAIAEQNGDPVEISYRYVQIPVVVKNP